MQYMDSGISVAGRIGVVLAALVLAFVLLAPGTARADSHLSGGCAAMNEYGGPSLVRSWSWSVPLVAGERVSVGVGEPSEGDVTGVTLSVMPDGGVRAQVDSDGFPGSVGYTVPADGRYIFWVDVVGADASVKATVAWSCGADLTPTFPETGQAYGKHVSEIAKSGGMGNEGYKPGSHSGFAKAVHGDDFNNGKKLGPKAS